MRQEGTEMQATRQVQSFPTRVIAIAFALAALAIGGALGYSLKPPTVTDGPTRVTVTSGQQPSTGNDCVRVDGHKAC
jgi:hypothetical protein